MTQDSTKAKYSAGKNALENFNTLASYAISGARKAKRRVHREGLTVTVIKDGYIVEVTPDGNEKVLKGVNSVDKFKPLGVTN
ncbi:hypothetical protein [Pseudoalteromonas sp. 1_2015MBL_MicDiv]|uniref:hypothetical protein n=1 Tax=Pseudoalteromonas sp. 1_2015MBL_MicDiv TaxID=1720343 RepID=UPI000BBE5FDF|nr:hypothetical protein [Pseudoalteromonas sp. 1_2015MBL_MicDiv]ATG78003.1 hypothetical protein AOR04_10920 [Pseudoalteromonas sp. 1_2015MBL_MicDiv]|tara:strand:- start:4277 stop:4522 length:246 start_codon:yes stop_codon:yes gene_type:complete